MNFTPTDQRQSTITEFSYHPLSPLFYQYINTLKEHHFHKEAEDLLQVASRYRLPGNRDIIRKIIIGMQSMVISDEEGRFQHLLSQL